MDVGRWSSPPSITLWQEKHDTLPLDDSRGSKYSILPSSTLAAVVGLSAGAGATSGNACQGPAAATAPMAVSSVDDRTMAVIETKRIALLPASERDANTVVQLPSLHKSEKYRIHRPTSPRRSIKSSLKFQQSCSAKL